MTDMHGSISRPAQEEEGASDNKNTRCDFKTCNSAMIVSCYCAGIKSCTGVPCDVSLWVLLLSLLHTTHCRWNQQQFEVSTARDQDSKPCVSYEKWRSTLKKSCFHITPPKVAHVLSFDCRYEKRKNQAQSKCELSHPLLWGSLKAEARGQMAGGTVANLCPARPRTKAGQGSDSLSGARDWNRQLLSEANISLFLNLLLLFWSQARVNLSCAKIYICFFCTKITTLLWYRTNSRGKCANERGTSLIIIIISVNHCDSQFCQDC